MKIQSCGTAREHIQNMSYEYARLVQYSDIVDEAREVQKSISDHSGQISKKHSLKDERTDK